MRADRSLLRQLQLAQSAVADVVIADISARVIKARVPYSPPSVNSLTKYRFFYSHAEIGRSRFQNRVE